MGILFGSCNSSPIPLSQVSPVIGEIISRDAIASTSIADNSQAIFHATGGATINNQIFTFSNGTWQNDNGEGIRIDSSVETKLTALYPANNGSILNNPYDNDTLEDVLITQSTFKDQTNIQLNFRHLFSRLTIHIHSSIAEEIEAVKIEVPKVVSIDPSNGTFTTSGTHPTSPLETNTGVYSCIVPSLPDCSVKLTFKFKSDKEVTHSLTHTFVSGHKYDCHVNRPGIRNAEDLIEFSKFINDPGNIGQVNSKFGEKIGENIVYRLLEDITLNDSTNEILSPIGDHSSTPFNNIFDGEGHTISGLKFKAYLHYGGLFGSITKDGVIKNLYIDHSSGPFNSTGNAQYGTGFIAGHNDGLIDNCHVTNSTITNNQSNTGGIAGRNYGKITNCSVTHTNITTSGTTPLGGITGYLYNGTIRNCYSANNTLKNTTGDTNPRGGIAGYVLQGTLQNCYVYKNTYDTRKTYRGLLIGQTSKETIANCFYGSSTINIIGNSEKTPKDSYLFNSSFCETTSGTPVFELLDLWVKAHSTYGCLNWTESTTLPAIFIH